MNNGYYRFISERVYNKTICQYVNGHWCLINELGPDTIYELQKKGLELDSLVEYMEI